MRLSKQAQALAMRRQEKTWWQVASYFGTSRRAVKRWVHAAEMREQQEVEKEKTA